ncbi:MAG: HprK-related kinase A [Motiliproteus sp.]
MRSKRHFFNAGRHSVCLDTDISWLFEWVNNLYPAEPQNDNAFSDFHINIASHRELGSLFTKQAKFTFAERSFFNPLAYEHAFPLMEWGLNWCVTNHLNDFTIIHAAVLAKGNKGVILPGAPGAGKSTLCAALAFQPGWRLLSDELTLFCSDTATIFPNPRPIALKDGSINVIKHRHPELSFTQEIADTHKGTIAYLKPPEFALTEINTPAQPRLLIFPKYQPSSALELRALPPANAMMRLAEQTFNYGILGEKAFTALNQFVRLCDCYELEYDGNLDHAVEQIEALL